MAKKLELPRLYPERLTRVSKAMVDRLNDLNQPVISAYQFFIELRAMYHSGQKLYLRSSDPTVENFSHIKQNIRKSGYIDKDPDYNYRAIRILSAQDLPAEDICCLVDPYCYVSHYSAMQRYSLTNRNPKNLHLTVPSIPLQRQMHKEAMQRDYGEGLPLPELYIMEQQGINHPAKVRNRPVQVFHCSKPATPTRIRGTKARISPVGRTFVDMLSDPNLCGGMKHVLKVWKDHAKKYLDEILPELENAPKTIIKARGGYILDEYIGLKDSRIHNLQKFAQRGGSRLLDPSQPYKPEFSEKWMISLNVE